MMKHLKKMMQKTDYINKPFSICKENKKNQINMINKIKIN